MKVNLSSQEVNLILLALESYVYLPVCKDLITKLSTEKPTIVLTYSRWKQQGRQVVKGSRSVSKNEKGEALFTIAQTKVKDCIFEPADVDYDDMLNWDPNY